MERKRLYFLTHEGNPKVFSGYGVPLNAGEKSHLVGVLVISGLREEREGYIKKLEDAFGEAAIGPVTARGDIGVYTQMRVEDPLSLSLVRDDLYGPKAEETRYVLEMALREGLIPKTRLKLCWSRERQSWVSELDV